MPARRSTQAIEARAQLEEQDGFAIPENLSIETLTCGLARDLLAQHLCTGHMKAPSRVNPRMVKLDAVTLLNRALGERPDDERVITNMNTNALAVHILREVGIHP